MAYPMSATTEKNRIQNVCNFFFLNTCFLHCRYLLIHGSDKKKVEFSLDEGAKVTGAALREKVHTIFNIAEARLQVWDKGFDNWMNLEDGDEVDTNSKIMVQEIKENLSCSTPPSVKSSLSLSHASG